MGGEKWGFELSEMEKELIAAGGITGAFRKFGKMLFEVMTRPKSGGEGKKVAGKNEEGCGSGRELQW